MNEIVKVDAKQYGLEESKAREIEAAFIPMISKMQELETEYNDILALDIDETTCEKAKALRLKYVKVRTGTAEIHKERKSFYLAGGRFVDGWKNAQLFASQGLEENLLSIEKHYENIEKERIEKIGTARIIELNSLGCDVIPQGIGTMDGDVYGNYIKGIKLVKEETEKAEKKAEQDRIETDRKEREERERIRKENEELKRVADENRKREEAEKLERDRIADIERKKLEKERAENQAKLKRVADEKNELEKKAKADEVEKDEELKRSKDKQNKRRVQTEVYEYIATISDVETAKKIATAIIKLNVPNVFVKY